MLQDQTATKTFREATHRYDQDATCREAWGIHKVSWRCSVCRLPTQHRFQVMELPAWGNSEISSCFMWVENLKELRLVWSQVWEVDSCYCSKACCPCWIRVLTKHSDQPGAKWRCANEYWQELINDIHTAAATGSIGGTYEGIKVALAPTQSKKGPLKTSREKLSSTKPSRWRDGWKTSQSSTSERTLLSPQQWTP